MAIKNRKFNKLLISMALLGFATSHAAFVPLVPAAVEAANNAKVAKLQKVLGRNQNEYFAKYIVPKLVKNIFFL